MQTYADMKDSGIDWLGDIPANWKLLNVSRIFNFAKGSEAQKLTSEFIGQHSGEYPVYSGQTSNGGIIGYYQNYEFDETGCILVTTVGAKAMTARFIQGKFSLSQNCLIMRPWASGLATHPKYYSYLVKPLFLKERSLIPDHMQPSMRMSDLSSYKVVVPDIDVQQKIADFLDTETAQIDNLIAKQERLLELLEEKRRATITHAVTRGLNPHVELKETNIPWLAQIPAHWSVAKIRYLANLKTGSTPKDNEGINQEGDGSGWITPGDFVTDLYINDWTKHVTASAQDKFKIRLFNSPSILFIGIGATAGKIGYVREPVYSNQQITAIMPNSKAVPEYMLYYLHTISGTIRSTAPYATLPIINNQFLSTVMHPVPGLTEQREIAHYLDEQDKKVNKLKQKIQTQITLLRERRTSLISHAVTGKVKIT